MPFRIPIAYDSLQVGAGDPPYAYLETYIGWLRRELALALAARDAHADRPAAPQPPPAKKEPKS